MRATTSAPTRRRSWSQTSLPTVVLSGAASVNEGSTHTYSYTVTDPGQDSFTVSAGYPSCGTGGSVSGTPSTTASGGSFDCVFPDGPATTNVAIKVADSDGASDTDSESVVVVQVANVNPSVSAPADQAANEGASTSFTLGSFSDPGPDSPWTVDVDWGDGSAHGTASKSTTGSLGSMSHTYADGPATRTVTVTVTDKNGGVGSASFQVTVANVAPTVALSAANDLAVNEGPAEHTYSYSISDPGADTVSSVSTSCGANGVKVAGSDTNTNTAGSFKCTFADGPASSVVSAQATDSDGAAGNTATQTVVVANVAPTVVLSGAASVNEGSTHTYSYTVTDPGQDSFTVSTGYPSCGTGGSVTGTPSTTASGGSFDCVFPDGPATTNVAIKVADSDGASDTDSESVVVVQVANVAPTVVLSGDTSANEGSTHTYTYTVSDPGDDPNPTVTESCGSGGTKTDTAAANSFDCTFPDGPASSTVTVSADDGDASNNIGSDSKTVTVANVAPTVALSAANDLAVNEGTAEHTYSYTISDPGADTVSSVSTSCGANGVKVAGSDTNTNTAGSFKCTFADGPANSTVSAQATDSDGAAGNTATQTVVVANVAPTVVLSGAASVNEGSTHTYSYTVTDPGQDSFTVSAGYPSCGTGGSVSGTPSTTASGGSFDCVFPDGPATTNVAIKVADSDGASDTDSESVVVVQVANVAPTVVLSGDTSANEGSTHTYTYTVSDPGDDPNPVVSESCGSGGTKTDTAAANSFDCTFPDGPASSTVTVSADDGDASNNIGSDSKTVTVANVAPTVVLSGAASVNEGSTHTYSYTVTDPGQDSFTVSTGYPSCGTGGSVTGTPSTTASGGSFDCVFPDGPATTNVAIKVADSDGASDTDSESVVVVQVANVAPTVVLSGDTSANEGSTHTYTYTVSDPGDDPNPTVTESCGSGGTKTDTAAANSFDCTFPDGPASPTVTVSADDGDASNNIGSDSKTVTVANVAPTVALSAANDLAVNEGAAEHTYSYTISDPGADTVSSVSTSCGANGVKVAGSDTNTNTAGSFKCTFADGPANSTVSAQATDSDGAAGNTATQTVVVANVAPTVVLSGAASVNEGSTHTYSYTVTDPGQDSFTVSTGYPSCGTGGSVSGTPSTTASGGSFDCVFPDGPATTNVAIKVADSDGASDTDSESVVVVQVANVAPTVVLSGDTSANEGSTHTYTYTVSDPGDDPNPTVTESCGSGGTKTDTAAANSFDCTFPDGPASSTVTVSADDGDASNNIGSDSKTVTVANVAPTVVLSGAGASTRARPTLTPTRSPIRARTASRSRPVTRAAARAAASPARLRRPLRAAASTASSRTGPPRTNVAIKVADSDGASDTDSESVVVVQVANVAPTVVLSGDTSANEGSTHTYTYTVSDPGDDPNPTVTESCGCGGTKTDTAAANSFDCTFPDGPESASVSVSADDGDASNNIGSDSKTVTVANVAPTVVLSGAASVNEGSTHTYTYTVSDPGQDSFTVSAGYPSCGRAAASGHAFDDRFGRQLRLLLPGRARHDQRRDQGRRLRRRERHGLRVGRGRPGRKREPERLGAG